MDIKLKKQYSKHDWDKTKVLKVFNRGMGRLILYQFDHEHKIVYINRLIFNKFDKAWLQQNYPAYTTVLCELGYPTWYFSDDLKSYKVTKL